MKLLEILGSLITEESLKDFYARFKKENPNPDFLDNNFKNPDFDLRLVGDGKVKYVNVDWCEYNRCETNVFKFIKAVVKSDTHRYYPVSGWAFMDSTSYFEHFWIYDDLKDLFIDITPMRGDKPYALGGVVNKDINDDILKADKFSDVDFLRGKVGSSLYRGHDDKESKPTFDSRGEKDLLSFVKGNENYKELYDLMQNSGIDDVKGLSKLKSKLSDLLSNSRSNREYDLYTKLINQIKGLETEL